MKDQIKCQYCGLTFAPGQPHKLDVGWWAYECPLCRSYVGFDQATKNAESQAGNKPSKKAGK